MYFVAMIKRGKKQDNSMMEYYLVIGAFAAVCVASILYVLMNPKVSFAQMQVIDESQILVYYFWSISSNLGTMAKAKLNSSKEPIRSSK